MYISLYLVSYKYLMIKFYKSLIPHYLGLSWWRVSATLHLDNGVRGQDLWQKFEELTKDFSQDQMKANPPNTSVDTGRKESLTKRKEDRAFLLNLLDCQNKEHCPGSDISSWLKNSSSPTQPFKLIICRFFSVCFQMPSTLEASLVPSKKACQPEASHCYSAMVFPLTHPCLVSRMLPSDLIVS